jgi:hypothetical protein
MKVEVVFLLVGDCLHAVEFNEAFEKEKNTENRKWQ